MTRTRREWADSYGSQWYKHYDGKPPHDDDNDYVWNGTEWERVWDDEEQETKK